MNLKNKLYGIGLSAFLFTGIASPVLALDSTTVVTPPDMATSFADVLVKPSSWFFFNDENNTIDNTLGSFVAGPATPPLGTESIQIGVTGTQRRNLATYQFSGTTLSSITTLAFSTYNASSSNPGSVNRSGYLNFNVDFNGSDTWQRRLVFVPSQNGTVLQNTWQEWDTLQGGNAKWVYSGSTWPVTGEPGTTSKTWNQILTDYPVARIRVTDSWLGVRVGEPYADGYVENIDGFKFGTSAGTTTFDFDLAKEVLPPTSKDQCKRDGWKVFTNPTFKNQGQCIKYVEHLDDDEHGHHSNHHDKDHKGRGHKDDHRDDDHDDKKKGNNSHRD